MNKILITGSSGLLGLRLIKYFKKKKWSIKKFKRNKKNDLSNFHFCNKYLSKKKFEAIVNLSAITDIDYCEKNKLFSKKVNYQIVRNICKVVKNKKLNTYLIQVSTDQFYNNLKKNKESNNNCKNFYTKTKLLAEKECEKINSIVLRTNFSGKSLNSKRNSFSDWIYKNLKNKKAINLADDIQFSPLSIKSLCDILNTILVRRIDGKYNIGSKIGFSKYKFGIKFAKKLNLDLKLINKVTYKDINFFAKRNKDMRMKVNKFEKKFNIYLPNLDNEIKKIAFEYKIN